MKAVLRAIFLLIILSALAKLAGAVGLSETHTNAICNGANNCSIDITVTSGTAPYTYVWNDGVTTEDRANIGAGTYNLTVTDFTGATAIISVNVTQPAGMTTWSNITPESCGGGSDGDILFNVSGGNPPYSFQWNDGPTTQNRTNVLAANYYVTVTDNIGCQKVDSANVTQPMGMVPSITVTNTGCNTNTGQIDLTVQYGYPAYSYQWSDGPTTEDRTALGLGTYTVVVTDSIGCSISASATVQQSSGAMNINSTYTNPTCYGGNNGSANVTSVVGSTGPYTYDWGGGNTNATYSNLTSGTYIVTVTSSTNCTATKTFNLTDPAQINLSLNPIAVTCYGGNNGVITSSTSGGTSPYSYNWGGIYTQNRSALTTGTYTLTVTDNQSCTVTASAFVNQPAQIVVTTIITPIACTGGNTASVTANVTGGTGSYTYWWGGSNFSATRSNVGAGTYIVTVTDAAGCTATGSGIVQAYTPISLSSTQVNDVCYNGNTGSINLTASNGLSPYTYLWSNAAVSQDIDSLTAGTYVVTVTDNRSCTATKSATITQPSFPISINSSITDVTCHGGNNGAISITPVNGVTPYSFNWGGGVYSQNRTSLQASFYVVQVSDNNGCSATGSYTVTEPSALIANATATDATCNGSNNGSIALTASGGFAPFRYLWSNTDTTQNLNNIGANTYSVTVTDNHNCTTTTSATVNQPTAIVVALTSTNVTCNGAANGSVNVTTSGGSGIYNYSWNDGPAIQNRTNLSNGTYTVTATDNTGCSTSASTVITQPAALSANTTATNAACTASNGTVTLTVTGGTSPYNFTWSDGPATQNRSGLSAGTYSVTVSDSSLCSATASAVINQVNNLSIYLNHANVRCNGQSNGAVSMGITSGHGPYTFSWSSGDTTQNISAKPAGSYSVTVSDAYGCVAIDSAIVSEPAALTGSVTGITDATCYGLNNGGINITAAGGTGLLHYSWSNTNTTQNLVNVYAGPYHVTVKDGNNCSITLNGTVNQPTQIVTSATSTDIVCAHGNTGSIALNVSGGTGTYTYLWNTGDTTQNISNQAAGSYAVTVTDASSCSVVLLASISQTNPVTISETHSNIHCNGGGDGSIAVTTTGGTGIYYYQWNTGATTTSIYSLVAGTYTVTTADNNNCSATASITITEPTAIQLNISSTNVGCTNPNSGSATVVASGGSGGYQYLWSNNGTTAGITNLAAGYYGITVTDAAQCTVSALTAVNPNTPVQVSFNTTNVTCNGSANGSVTAIAGGGAPTGNTYLYNWSNGGNTETLSNVSAGTYNVTVSDGHNCQSTASAIVNQPTALQIAENHNNVSCHGTSTGSIHVSGYGGTGNYIYVWNTGATTQQLSNLAAGNYTITISDANSCSASLTINVQEAPAMSATETHADYACQTTPGSAHVALSGGVPPYSYTWSTGESAASANQLSAGTYTVTLSDAVHCSVTETVTIAALPPLTTTLTKTDAGCYGNTNGSINLDVSGGTSPYQFNWNNGGTSANQQNLGAGNYSVVVSDANHCSATNSTTITQATQIQVANVIQAVTCFGGNNGAVNLSVSGGVTPYNYTWNNQNTNQNLANATAGNYSVTITDAALCSTVSGFTIQQPAQINIATAITMTGCGGVNSGAVAATVTGGIPPYRLLWNNSDSTESINHLPVGTYTLTVTDSKGCTNSKVADVTQVDPITLIPVVTNTSCAEVENGSINVNATGGAGVYNYIWNNASTSESLSSLPAGDYSVTVNDAYNCSAQATIHVGIEYNLQVQAGATNSIGLGEFTPLTATTNMDHGNTYTWAPGDYVTCSTCANTTASPMNNTIYTVNVTDANGCHATDTVSVEVHSVSNIFIPNAITPNNDGNNDVLKLYGDVSSLRYLEFMIFDRWGEKIFDTNDHNFVWDGTYKNETVERGVYIYTMKAVFSNGEKKEYQGSITVLK